MGPCPTIERDAGRRRRKRRAGSPSRIRGMFDMFLSARLRRRHRGRRSRSVVLGPLTRRKEVMSVMHVCMYVLFVCRTRIDVDVGDSLKGATRGEERNIQFSVDIYRFSCPGSVLVWQLLHVLELSSLCPLSPSPFPSSSTITVTVTTTTPPTQFVSVSNVQYIY